MQLIEEKTYSPEEYLELEIASQERHEYIDEEIIYDKVNFEIE